MTGRISAALCCLALSLCFALPARSATPDLAYYLPTADSDQPTTYDESIPTPAEVFGFQPGDWHLRHDQLVDYMERLAQASDRVTLRETGRTYEGRRLVVLTITSPENHARLGQIQAEHLALSDPAADAADASAANTADLPAVAYLGYSVHGNEASGSNAAPLVAYYLAAGRGEEVERILQDLVVLLDPSMNPDGMARFAQWVNMHRGAVPSSDPNHREHNEPWPSGRTNHYWFDLNRDWLLVQHPETRARLATFRAWRPNVLTDHHEMGTDSTYFFQPGVDSRKNPLTPPRNVELTQMIAEHHAKALDKLGSLFYTGESFDDFYYGKGSTYPDIQGAVGILFEQASSRGFQQESENGPEDGVLTFPFAVRNHVTTSLSTLRAALEHRRELLDYQHDFYRDAAQETKQSALFGWVVADGGDQGRLRHMAEVLKHHDIETHALGARVEIDGRTYEPASSLVVPLRQRQSRLAKALFLRQTEFEDDTFYDVSTWTLPSSFGLPFAELTTGEAVGAEWQGATAPLAFEANDSAVAYALEWNHYAAPSALNRLQRAGIGVRVAGKGLRAETATGIRGFEPGTLLVHLGFQKVERRKVLDTLGQVATEDGIVAVPVLGGLTPGGPDLGSPSVWPLEAPKVAILVGRGVSSYEVGEAWHLLDHRFGIETTLLDLSDLGSADLGRYSHLVLVNGRGYSSQEGLADHLREWVRDGGVVIGFKEGASWSSELLSSGEDEDESEERGKSGKGESRNGNGSANGDRSQERKPYADYEQDAARKLISGTIFETQLDLTHPLAFGYQEELLPVFKDSTDLLEVGKSPYTTVAAFTKAPLISGYVSKDNLDELKETPAVIAERLGRGAVVRFAFDPNFRAVWYGTSRLFLNSLFLSGILERRDVDEPRMEAETH